MIFETLTTRGTAALGTLIAALENINPDKHVVFADGRFPGMLHSYRGYYSDLAFNASDSSDGFSSVWTVLYELKDTVGQVFEGYKGGDYSMDLDTPVWVSEYGRSDGIVIVGLIESDEVVTLLTARLS